MRKLNKNYIGSVDYSAEDSVFYGKIDGIGDLVDYEAESMVELKDAFIEAVEDYLAFCKDEGIVPEKSSTTADML